MLVREFYPRVARFTPDTTAFKLATTMFLVDADAEQGFTRRQAQFHVGHCRRVGPMAHGVFAVVDHVKRHAAFLAQCIDEAINRSIALALDGLHIAIHRDLGRDRLLAVV